MKQHSAPYLNVTPIRVTNLSIVVTGASLMAFSCRFTGKWHLIMLPWFIVIWRICFLKILSHRFCSFFFMCLCQFTKEIGKLIFLYLFTIFQFSLLLKILHSHHNALFRVRNMVMHFVLPFL